MEVKFLIKKSSGTFGSTGQQITANDVIVIERYKDPVNLDYSFEQVKTNIKYLDKDVFSQTFQFNGATLFQGIQSVGYNSGFSHNLEALDFIGVYIKKVNADPGDPFGGGWYPVETVFGAKRILYGSRRLSFEVEESDQIVELDKTYQFHFQYTTS